MASGNLPAFDPALLIDVAGAYLLGEEATLTRRDVARLSGMDVEEATSLWRSLGFPEVGDDDVVFTSADVEALVLTRRLVELEIPPAEALTAFARTLGRTFSRLADWQTRLMLAAMSERGAEGMSLSQLDEILPLVEQVQNIIWRRHLAASTSRALLRDSEDPESSPLAIGFVDIVGYTSLSRRVNQRQLALMVDEFEQQVTELVGSHEGQIIKTIGDEVLYSFDDPRTAAEVALRLTELSDEVESFPEVRVGSAYGHVLSRFGDVYGPVVNVASRLTSVAKAGTAVVDRELADTLRDDRDFQLRRLRRTSVKGYDHLEPWQLKRAKLARLDHLDAIAAISEADDAVG